MKSLLQVKNLKKYFKTPQGMLHAVDNVSFEIKKGEILGVVGESGCGKSTLGRSLLHLLEPSSGEIIYDGVNITEYNKKQMKYMRQKMQIIFQDPFASLDPRKTVKETIEEPLKIYKILPDPEERQAFVKKIMATVGLSERLINAYPHELDGGRRQRIGIARALVLDPEFIVCDEPVSALDVSVQAQILNLMQDLQEERGLTYMFVTHDLSVVKHISNRIIVMYLGEIVEMSSTDDLFESPMHPYTQALLSAVPIPRLGVERNRIILNGEISSPIEPEPGCRFRSRCPYAMPICETDCSLTEITSNHFVRCHKVQMEVLSEVQNK